MSSAVNEPQDRTSADSVAGESAGTTDGGPYPAGVAEVVRPLGEVGVLPLGGELDPIDSADQPVGEVGQLPGAVVGD